MNQDALAMVEKLAARLEDVKEVIEECPCEMEDLAKRLDRIDDQLYLAMVDIETECEKFRVQKEKSESKVVPLKVDEGADEFDASLADEQTQASVKTNGTKGTAGSSSEKSDSDEEDHKSFLSDEMKENMKEGARALNGIYKDGKEVVSELSDAMADIKSVFDIKSKFKR